MEIFQKLVSFIIFLVNTIKDLVYNVSGGKAGKKLEDETTEANG